MAQKARYINPERKQKSKVERLGRVGIGRSRKGEIMEPSLYDKICDKCGCHFSLEDRGRKYPRVYVTVEEAFNGVTQLDLCASCMREIYDFIFGENLEE